MLWMKRICYQLGMPVRWHCKPIGLHRGKLAIIDLLPAAQSECISLQWSPHQVGLTSTALDMLAAS